MAPYAFDATGPTYLYLSSLNPHGQYSGKKAHELTLCEKWVLRVKDGRTNAGEKTFVCNKNVKAIGHKEEVIQHQTIQTLPQSFKYKECGNAFLEKTACITSNGTDLKMKSYLLTKLGENQCDKSILIIAQSSHPKKSHHKFNGCECTENRNSFSRITQRTDIERSSFRQKSHVREHQEIHVGLKPFEHGKNFSHKAVLSVLLRTHPTDRSLDYDSWMDPLGYQSAFSAHHRTHVTVRPDECPQCGKPCSMSSRLTQPQESHTGEKRYECRECGKVFTEKSHRRETL